MYNQNINGTIGWLETGTNRVMVIVRLHTLNKGRRTIMSDITLRKILTHLPVALTGPLVLFGLYLRSDLPAFYIVCQSGV